jgi:hypothetical protein
VPRRAKAADIVKQVPVTEHICWFENLLLLSPNNHQAFTVLKAAACVLHTIQGNSCTFEAATKQMDTVCYSLLQGDPSPDNPNNRYPLSMHVCSAVCWVCQV